MFAPVKERYALDLKSGRYVSLSAGCVGMAGGDDGRGSGYDFVGTYEPTVIYGG